MRILIAEDDFTSRTMLSAVLKKWGYDVVSVANGLQAWEILQSQDAPKLALLDWNMPEMDGLEVVRRVRGNSSSEPAYIIILTANGEKRDIVEGLEAGANDYVTKPYDQDELRARLQVGGRMVGLQASLSERMLELQKALGEVRTLRGIVPICAGCKKIRDDRGYWNQVEVYVREHSEAQFSHCLCPECLEKLYPEFAEEVEAGEP